MLASWGNLIIAQKVDIEVKARNDSSWKYMYSNPDLAKEWASKGRVLAEKKNDLYSLGAATTRYAISFDLAGDFELALKYYFKSLTYLKEYTPSEELGFLYNNLSLCYYNFYDYSKALKYVKRAYENDAALMDSSGMASALTNMGLFYGYLEQEDSAIWAFERSIDISKPIGDTLNWQSATSNKAKLIFQKGNYREALEIYRSIEKLILSDVAKISWCISLSQTYLKLKQAKLALAYADSALVLSTKNQQRERILYSLENYAEIASETGHTEVAFEKYRAYIALKDSLFKTEMDERVATEEARFQVVEKEKEAAEAKSLALEAQVEKETFFYYLLISIGLLLFVFLIVVLLIILNRTQRKTNELSKEKLEQKELFMHEIHHRVKNNLQMINAMIDIQLANGLEDKDSFHQQLKERIASMAKTHEFLYENHDFQGIQLDVYMEEFRTLFADSNAKNIRFHFQVDPIVLHVDSVIPLSLILSEWIINSLKHAFNTQDSGQIEIQIHLKEDLLEVLYSDNGSGMDKEGEGFGSSMVRSLARQLKAKILVDSSDGTRYKMSIERFKLIEEN